MANSYSVSLDGSSGEFYRNEEWEPSSFTIEAWVKLNSTSGLQTIFAANFNDISFNISSGIPRLTLWNGSSLVSYSDTTTLQTDTWYYIAVTFDGSNIKFYVNGTNTSSTTGTLAFEAGVGDKYTVASRDGIQFLNGKIDEVRVWHNTVRSNSQISSNYNVELNGNETGFYAYYKLEFNYNDTTANGRTITPTGSVSFSTDVPFGTNATTTSTSSSTTTSTTTTSTSTTLSSSTSTSTSITTTSTSTTTTSTSTTTTSTSTSTTTTSTSTTSTSTTTTSTSTTTTSTTTTIALYFSIDHGDFND